MQRRLRNTLAIAIAGGAVIIGAGTAAAASPADDLTGSAPQLGSATDQLGSVTKDADKGKGKGSDGVDSATPDLGSATDSLPTKDLGKGVQAPGLSGLGG